MENFLAPLKNAWKIPDLKKKLLITFLLLVVYRVGVYIPVPGLSASVLASMAQNQSGLFGFLNIIGGGAFENASIFTMSITPYINASIIMQLLTIAIPALERLQKEGEEGRKKLAQWVRYGTVILGFLQATFTYIGFRGAIVKPSVLSYLTITFALTAGTAFIMWLGEQINEYGIGNGISLIIFVNIISRGPQAASTLYGIVKAYSLDNKLAIGILIVAAIIVVFVAVVMFVIWVTQAERRIPVQYAKRVVGRKMYGGQSTHIPLKVNVSGVIPIIFAMSFLAFLPTLIGLVAPNTTSKFLLWIANFHQHWLYMVVYALLILFFTFFYTIMVFNPVELANNIKKNGGFIPGIRPGKPTADYISKVLNRITWFGAFFLAIVAVLPILLGFVSGLRNMWFGGTSALIMVGVALDTMKAVESQLMMRHYKGFLE
ncbi:MAG TPA: preprotein translocase subunit SecY [Thermoclostridium caenicola]|mgnify:FL=1|uniref:preprotein translocase subunit SecY n=1 Tax=Thermoclostridium caenicola TaxID=659425 RepID=UPI002CA45EED|nr:preprotein translocase subunit SecY [Thermoclostridium caenicola]HOK42139.1 preprotein translocase subunit SecY [Thermoclostridium caenicola]HOL83940.1 preprotein translocase subunit SecY [Thermoclostridium caenicola]HPO75573.1 preprotein translocase subunit SecY [Thermoclostridium caenicola]